MNTRPGQGADRRGTPAPGFAVAWALFAAAVVALGWWRLDHPILAGAAGGAHVPWPEMRVDLNAADAATLRALPGVGPRLAARIVADRAARGPFRGLEDLQRVPRVGPALVERIRRFAVVGGGAGGRRPRDDTGAGPIG